MKILLTSDTHFRDTESIQRVHTQFWTRVAEAIKSEGVSAVIWAGDIASSSQEELEASIKQARDYIQVPILLVRGNHDFWDQERLSWGEINRGHESIFKRYQIHHLDSPYVLDDVIIAGWDGWYGTSNPQTNDAKYLPRDVEGCPIHTYLSNKAWRDFEKVMELDVSPYRKSVAVTHFNPYCEDPKWVDMSANLKFYDQIKTKFDVFCCGHNHQGLHRVEATCLVVNSGSDYGIPRFKIFEV